MGIGLTICRTILEAHGGRIDVVSDGSSGAAFHFRVPFAAQRGI
jgi:two-component system sensor kinase FixL